MSAPVLLSRSSFIVVSLATICACAPVADDVDAGAATDGAVQDALAADTASLDLSLIHI